MASLRRLVVGGSVGAWERAGFDVTDGEIRLEGVTLQLDESAERGVTAWGVEGIDREVDGLAIVPAAPAGAAAPHPNGVTRLDHVVVLTRDLEATLAAFAEVGVEPRATRDVPDAEPPRRQAFLVLDSAVCELVGPVGGDGQRGSARFWGLAFVAPDLEDTVAALGLLCGPVRDAVQPGRRIATLRHRAVGIPAPIVLMSPRPASS